MTTLIKTFDISIDKRFHQELTSLPKSIQKKVVKVVDGLRNDPWTGAKQLKGSNGIWRQKAEAYRILYTIGTGWVHVYSVQHRQGVYAGNIAKPTTIPSAQTEVFPVLDDKKIETLEGTQITQSINYLHIQESINENWLYSQGLKKDLVDKILDCKKPEDFEGLIDFGIPDELFDKLWELMKKEQEQNKGKSLQKRENTRVQLVRQNVIDYFFGRLVRLPIKSNILDLTIVSPWITPWNGRTSSLSAVIRYAILSKARLTVITRKPELPNHVAALQQLERINNLEIVHLPGLHAKYFICDVAPIPFALLGSANVTEQSLANFEIGVLIRGSGDAESFVRELQSLTFELRAMGELVRRRK